MTSKSLLCKMCGEDVKSRIWAIAISILGFIFTLPVYLLMSIEQRKQDLTGALDKAQWKPLLLDEAKKCLGSSNTILMVFTILLAVLCGVSAFSYLNSRKKVDFYHSIPVKRETLFMTKFIVSIGAYVIPYIVALTLSCILAHINDVLSKSVLKVALYTFGLNVIFYITIFAVVVIAMLLTGQIVVSALAIGVFFFYGPILSLIIRTMSEAYFKTYCYQGTEMFTQIINKCSPVGAYIVAAQALKGNKYRLSSFLILCAIMIILTMISYLLYKKRKSEVAGKAIAYKKSQVIIKLAVSVPVGILGGIIIRQFYDNVSFLWISFGMITSYLLCSIIMEIIFNFDFKAGLKHKGQLLLGGVLLFLFFGTFRWDFIQYDSYVPNRSSIDSMAIAVHELDNDVEKYVMDSDFGYYHSSNTEYADKFMKIRNIDDAYKIGKLAVKNNLVNEDNRNINTFLIDIIYRLNTGRKVYRSYEVPVDSVYESLNKVYQTEEYKRGVFPIYQISNVTQVRCKNEFQELDMTLSKEEISQLLTIFREEITNLSLDTIRKEEPVGTLTLYVANNGTPIEMYVYPSYTNTVEFLSSHGFKKNQTRIIDNVESITAEYTIPYDERNREEYQQLADNNNNDAKDPYTIYKVYKDKEQIKKILPYLIESKYAWNNGIIKDYDTFLSISVIKRLDEFGNKETTDYAIRTKDIPEWLKKDIMYFDLEKKEIVK